MTLDGVRKLIGFQKRFFGRAFRLETDGVPPQETVDGYMEALAELEDKDVLDGYMKAIRRGRFDRLPSMAMIIAASGSYDGGKGTWRCTLCDLPWDSGHGRYDPKERGQIRCPNCNAVLQHELKDGYIPANDIEF